MRRLASKKDLELAWKRVQTAQNVGYKRFYRRVFDALDIGLHYPLATLRTSLLVQAYEPHPAQRVLAAKPSGLQRPFTFLDPRDQIVLQAIVNIAACHMEPKRRPALATSVCSNRLTSGNSIHFFKPWQDSYSLFRRRIEARLKAGYVYAADFDLASFYDTISHTRLADIIFRRNAPISKLLLYCLHTWSPRRLHHGLPQGPAASDYLAECYLSVVDAELARQRINFVRYVDDIVIFGKTPAKVQSGILALETLCREFGLIPQAGKFKAGRKVTRASELVKAASGYAYALPIKGELLTPTETIRAYTAAIFRRSRIVSNPTLAKRALFRGAATDRLLPQVLKDIEKNPAFIEAFSAFLQRFGPRRRIARFMQRLIRRRSPYLFVQGEYWNILVSSSRNIDPSMAALARQEIASDGLPATLRMALYAVLLKDSNRTSAQALVHALRKERTDWVRAWALSYFSRILHCPEAKRFAASALRRDTLAACSSAKIFAESMISPPTFPLPAAGRLSKTALGSLQQLGIVRRSAGRAPDAVSTLLASGFGVPHWRGWRKLLGTRYEQARICLQLGLSEFDGNPSSWMGNVDSFNDIAIRCVMDLARAKLAPPNLPPAHNKRKRLTDYGYFLAKKQWLDTAYPKIRSRFFSFHDRRNHLTSSHAFDSITAAPNKPLKHAERKPFVRSLKGGYTLLQQLAQSLI